MIRTLLCLAVAGALTLVGSAKAQPQPQPLGDLGFTVVLNGNPPRLSQVDNRSRKLVRVLPTHRSDAAFGRNVELSPNGRFAYVLHADNAIMRLDLEAAAPEPTAISPHPSAVTPGYALVMRDLELSGDGRYLVATAFDQGAWYYGLPQPRNRLSVYDLAAGTSAHRYLDLTLNDAFPPALDVVIDAHNRAWITDGDFGQVVAVDLATLATAFSFPSATPVATSPSGNPLPPPLVDIALTSTGPGWVPGPLPGVQSYVRIPDVPSLTHADHPYSEALLHEIEARPGTPWLALSRPAKTASFTGPAPDVVVLMHSVTGTFASTPKLAGSHRFCEIEFRDALSNGKVYGLDWAADLFFIADFQAWLLDPLWATPTITTVPLPLSVLQARQASDGLVAPGGQYAFHDARGRLAFLALADGALLGYVDLVPGQAGDSVDLEVLGDLRSHAD